MKHTILACSVSLILMSTAALATQEGTYAGKDENENACQIVITAVHGAGDQSTADVTVGYSSTAFTLSHPIMFPAANGKPAQYYSNMLTTGSAPLDISYEGVYVTLDSNSDPKSFDYTKVIRKWSGILRSKTTHTCSGLAKQ